jgi:CrcB protein
MKQFLFVGLGGFLGTLCRYLLYLIMDRWSDSFQMGILLANLLGCWLIGLIVGWLSFRTYQPVYGFLAIGFCGGFTTFSSFALDGLKMIRQGHWLPLAGYLSVSIVGGLILCAIGIWMGNKLS